MHSIINNQEIVLNTNTNIYFSQLKGVDNVIFTSLKTNYINDNFPPSLIQLFILIVPNLQHSFKLYPKLIPMQAFTKGIVFHCDSYNINLVLRILLSLSCVYFNKTSLDSILLIQYTLHLTVISNYQVLKLLSNFYILIKDKLILKETFDIYLTNKARYIKSLLI